MTLIVRVPTDETVERFRRAARKRYNEANGLIARGERLAGVYLCGYTTEMLLKAAFFRLEGYGPQDPLSLSVARWRAKSLGLPRPANLHDLPWWAALLVESRKVVGRPYASSFTSQLVTRVNRIYGNWREYLRYRVNRPFIQEVVVVRDSTTWLLGQYRFLY